MLTDTKLSNGIQTGPPIGAQKGPLSGTVLLVQVANRRAPRARVARFTSAGGAGAWEVPVCPPGRSWPRFRLHSGWNASGGKLGAGMFSVV